MNTRLRKFMSWWDERLPISETWEKHMTGYPAPKNFNVWYFFGSLLIVVLVLQLATGVFLAIHYQPNTHMAYWSVLRGIMRDANWGWLVRYMHIVGASAFFVLVYLHMFRSVLYGSHRKPRELLWWTGQLLLLLLMAISFMGYLLPWGQMSYWGAEVITNLFRATPFIGDKVVIWLRGDFAVGDATLTRFFALHFLFPFIIAGAVVIHLVALHTVKSSNPSGINLADKDNIPFHPYFTIKDMYGLGVYLIIFFTLVFFFPHFFIEPNNNIPANPMQTPPHIEPEWYFLPFYAILRSVPDLVGGVVAMGLSVMIFAGMPYMDRSRIPGGARYRPWYGVLLYQCLGEIVFLGYVGSQPVSPQMIIVGRVASFVYFGVFLILPFMSKLEERMLIKRGLPPAVQALIEGDKA